MHIALLTLSVWSLKIVDDLCLNKILDIFRQPQLKSVSRDEGKSRWWWEQWIARLLKIAKRVQPQPLWNDFSPSSRERDFNEDTNPWTIPMTSNKAIRHENEIKTNDKIRLFYGE